MPLGPDFARALGISTAHLGLIAGSYTAAAAVAGIVARALPRSLRPAQGAGRRAVRPGDRHRGGRARAGADVAGDRARDRGRVRRPGDVDRAVDHRRRRAAGAARARDGRRDGRLLGRLGARACRSACAWRAMGGWRLPFLAVAAMGVGGRRAGAARDAADARPHRRPRRPASRPARSSRRLLGDRTIRAGARDERPRHADGVPRHPQHRRRTCCRTSASRATVSTRATWSAAQRASSSCVSRAARSIATAPRASPSSGPRS